MENNRKGFSLIELLIVVAIILVIAGIAIPSLLRSKIAANEVSAIGSLRTMDTAFVAYVSTYSIGYPATLSSLAPSATPTSTAADLLDAVLASGSKSGYTFTYTAGPPAADGIINSYTITGVPVRQGVTGQRGFYTDQTLVIRANATGTASATDLPI